MNIKGFIDVTIEGVDVQFPQGGNWIQPPLPEFETVVFDTPEGPWTAPKNRVPLEYQDTVRAFQQEAQAKTDQAVLMNQEILALKQAYEALQQDYQVAVQAGQGLFEDRARLFNENLQLKQLLAPLQNTIFGQAVQQEEQSAQPEPTMGYGPSGRMSPQ